MKFLPPPNFFEKYFQILLKKNRVSILAKDKLKRTPLLMACKNGNSKICALLLKNGSLFDFPDSSSNTPLHYAAAYGYYNIINLLLKAGADINLKNSW